MPSARAPLLGVIRHTPEMSAAAWTLRREPMACTEKAPSTRAGRTSELGSSPQARKALPCFRPTHTVIK